MSKRDKIESREVGLEAGLLLGKHLFNTEHLHYGYWTDDLSPELRNLPEAQERHSEFLISHIPADTQTILDVGCGVGALAEKLLDADYRVDCVSPSTALTRHTRERLGSRSHVFECRLEDLETQNRYDLILFSESFQYSGLQRALEKSVELMNDAGHLLICDFFKTDAEGKSVIGGGHSLARFYDLASRCPLKALEDIDITTETAPTLDIANELLMNVGRPIWNLTSRYMDDNYPFLSRLLRWKYRHKIRKIDLKYFSGARNSKTFATFKSYRLLLYRKIDR